MSVPSTRSCMQRYGKHWAGTAWSPPWISARSTAISAIKKLLGKSYYNAIAGSCTWLSGVFWGKIEEESEGLVRFENEWDIGNNKVKSISAEIEEYYHNFTITANLLELRNIATVASTIIECSRLRKESRGLHYNLDYPDRDDINWAKDTIVKKDSAS